MSVQDEWGEPVEAERKPAHNFDAEPVVVGTFQRTDQIKTTDRDTGEPRLSSMHRFLDDNAEPVDCWGTTMLDDLLRGVQAGQRVRIQYLGMETLDSGRSIKRFELRLGASRPPLQEPVNPPDDDIPF